MRDFVPNERVHHRRFDRARELLHEGDVRHVVLVEKPSGPRRLVDTCGVHHDVRVRAHVNTKRGIVPEPKARQLHVRADALHAPEEDAARQVPERGGHCNDALGDEDGGTAREREKRVDRKQRNRHRVRPYISTGGEPVDLGG